MMKASFIADRSDAVSLYTIFDFPLYSVDIVGALALVVMANICMLVLCNFMHAFDCRNVLLMQ